MSLRNTNYNYKLSLNRFNLILLLMNKNILLILAFIIVLVSRLYFSFQTDSLSSDDSYFHLRQIENILNTGKPLFNDQLSYSGREYIFAPLFHYIIAGISIIIPLDLTIKIIPSVLISTCVFLFYLITKKITGDNYIALITGFFSGFIPIMYKETINQLNPLSLLIPLILIIINSLINIKEKRQITIYLIAIIMASLTHPLISLLLIGILIYVITTIIDDIEQTKYERELILFSIFFILWTQFLIYKKMFLFHGLNIIWQNIPKEIINEHFIRISVIEAIYQIGILQFIAGIYIVFKYFLKEKNKNIYLLTSFVITIAISLWFKLIELKIGLIIFGIILTLLSAKGLKIFIDFIGRTKLSKFNNITFILVIIILTITLVIPSIINAKTKINEISKEEISAMNFIKDNSDDNSIILASDEEGHLITQVAKRKNVIDNNFPLIKNIDKRYEDIKTIYKTTSLTEAIDLMDKYKVTHLLLTQKIKNKFNIKTPDYLNENKCFEKLNSDKIEIYLKKKSPYCKIKEIRV